MTGVTIGPANLSAASDGKTGTLAMSVVDPNAPATITLTSKSAIPYPAGYVDVLLSAVTNGLGSTVTPTLTWTTSDPNVATVDQQGSVLGVGAGTVTITATAPNNVSGTEHLTIEPHTAATTAIYRDHLAFGAPVGADPSDILLSKTQYVVSYNPNRLGADWVSWNLNGSQFGPAPRCNCFSPDPESSSERLPRHRLRLYGQRLRPRPHDDVRRAHDDRPGKRDDLHPHERAPPARREQRWAVGRV